MTDTIETVAPESAPTPSGAEATQAPTIAVRHRRTVFAGYTAAQLLVGLALVAAVIWGMWVTRSVMGEPPQKIVKADLSRIVGDYVQAQSRSATPPDQVQVQMRQFMASLDNELQRRGAQGQVVLVGEAVLSKSVTDITPDVMKAVYSSGVKRPVPATQDQMNQMLSAAQAGAAQAGVPQQVVPMVPMPAAAPAPVAQAPFGPMPGAQGAEPSQAPAAMPGASVSSFGGPNGPGGQ